MGDWLVIISDRQHGSVAYYGPFDWETAADMALNNRFVVGSPKTFEANCVPLCPPEKLS